MRRRRSTRSSSGTSMRKGRTSTSSPTGLVILVSFPWNRASIYANEAMVGGGAYGVRVTPSLRLAQRSEPRAELLGEQLGLFPGRKVTTFFDLVEVDEVRVGPLGPTPRGLICLAGKDARGHRNGDALGVPEATLVFPIETRRRDPRVRQPIKRDVVEDVVTRQFARGARGPVQSCGDRRRRLAATIIVVEKPGGQADG